MSPVQIPTATHFLSINQESISLTKAFEYLQSSGSLGNYVGEIVRQYILEKELAERPELEMSQEEMEKVVVSFRLEQQLTTSEYFEQWLIANEIDYATFQHQIGMSYRLEKLKATVTEPKLQEAFIEQKLFLDQVVLSRIIVDDRDLAQELQTQIQEGEARFEDLTREYSLAEDRIVNGMMGSISRGDLPDLLRAAVDQTQPGETVGPLDIDGEWCLVRVEKFLPASLGDDEIQETLRNELFEAWLSRKIQALQVELPVT